MTATKERPILFSGPMVRAILESRKTQTRRVARPQFTEWTTTSEGELWPAVPVNNITSLMHCPYGQPGDRLWVRETWSPAKFTLDHPNYAYHADGEFLGIGRWRPSIHMPRHVSRIVLEVIGVRVERVQDIKHRDALAEGVSYDVSQTDGAPVPRFKSLWDSINAKRGYGWDVNPWVWVVEFKRL